MAVMQACPDCHRKQSEKNRDCIQCGADLAAARRSKRVRYWISLHIDGKLTWRRPDKPFSIQNARACEAKLRGLNAEGRILDISLTKKRFREVSEWFLRQKDVRARPSYKTLVCNLGKFNEVFGDYIVSAIKPSDLKDYQTMREKEGKSPSYIDQQVGAMVTALRRAIDEEDMLPKSVLRPFEKTKRKLKAGQNRRKRVLSIEEFGRLVEGAIHYLKPVLLFAWWTGARRREILTLEWSQVNLKARMIKLKKEFTKTRQPRDVPISDPLAKVLSELPRPIKGGLVFTRYGQPIRELKTTVAGACKRAGIVYGREVEGGFIFRDLRKTFLTDMDKAGVNWLVSEAIVGHEHKSLMFARYREIDDEDRLRAIDELANYRHYQSIKTAHIETSETPAK